MKNLFIRFGREPQEILPEMLRFTFAVIFLCALMSFFPVFQLSIFIVCALYTALTYRNGILFSIVSMVLSATVFFSLNMGMTAFSILMLGSMGIVVGEVYYRKNNMLIAIMTGAVMMIMTVLLSIYSTEQLSGTDFIEYMFNSSAELKAQKELSDMLNYDFEELKTMMRTYLPSFVMVFGLGVGVLNYFFAGQIIRRFVPEQKEFRSFGEFMLPGSAMVALLITLVGVVVVEKLTGYSTDLLKQNLTIIYSFLFTIQGLAVLDRMVMKSRPSFFRNITLVLAVCTFFLYPFFVTVGVLDSIFNIRRLPR